MAKRHLISWLLTTAILVFFLGGLWHLFALRFTRGDIYPPYSSLRADPLGSRALYESLAATNHFETQRFHGDLQGLPDPEGTTFWVLGHRMDRWRRMPAKRFRSLEHFVIGGGRLILAFRPSYERNGPKKDPSEKKEDPKEDLKDDPTNEEIARPAPPQDPDSSLPVQDAPHVAADRRWAVDVQCTATEKKPLEKTAHRWVQLAAPAQLPWSSGCHFNIENQEIWEVLYAVDEQPVIIQRHLGKGSIVLLADSYLFSNEALRFDRQLDLLIWAMADNDRIVFDESHLGIRKSFGIAALARKYRLHGLLCGLCVLALFFVWKAACPLVPPADADTSSQENAIEDLRSATDGLAGLLQRRIAPTHLIHMCIREWNRFARNEPLASTVKPAHTARLGRKRKKSADQVVAEYRQLVEDVSKRKKT